MRHAYKFVASLLVVGLLLSGCTIAMKETAPEAGVRDGCTGCAVLANDVGSGGASIGTHLPAA